MKTTAFKFVRWDVPPLEALSGATVYRLRGKLNAGERLSREEKNWITNKVNNNSYFRNAIPLMGYRFDFPDVLRTCLVLQYGRWTEYLAVDITSLRAMLVGKPDKIIDITNL
jgi:hypothetical protein